MLQSGDARVKPAASVNGRREHEVKTRARKYQIASRLANAKMIPMVVSCVEQR
jgi:hypothetical protein